MDEVTRFAQAVVDWAAGGPRADRAALTARATAAGVRTVVLVEGASDRAALDTVARRSGRDFEAERVSIVPIGGATSIGRFIDLLGPGGLGIRLAGLCDVGEERFFRRSLERAGLGPGLTRIEDVGFFVCVDDLEDEFIRSLGVETVEQIVESAGELRRLRTFRNQPAQRGRRPDAQLRRFLGTMGGRKIRYASLLADASGPARLPDPLRGLLAYVS